MRVGAQKDKAERSDRSAGETISRVLDKIRQKGMRYRGRKGKGSSARKRVILHIGQHKTGTSSLQRHLLQNAEVLRSEGYNYPAEQLQGFGHHPIAHLLERRALRGLDEAEKRNRIEEAKEKISSLAGRDDMVLVLSSEAFQNVEPAVMRSVFDPRYFEVNIIFYAREQASYLASAYNQKVHATWFDESVEEFCEKNTGMNYLRFAKSWKSKFENVTFRLFDKQHLYNGSTTEDFCNEILGIQSYRKETEQERNRSLPRKVLALKREVNKKVNQGEVCLRRNYGVLYRRCMALAEEDFSGPFRLPRSVVERVQSQHAESNEAFFREFVGFGPFSEYQPADDDEPEIIPSDSDVYDAFGDIVS